MDYRYLNAITQKCKFTVPIFDELLDKLEKAKWFSALDLASSYHQILLAPGKSFKTTFQTHQGHYEFKVMPFGLTRAPATFLEAMNETLAPLIRKCVLVFFDDILIYSSSLEEHLHHIRLVLQLLAREAETNGR